MGRFAGVFVRRAARRDANEQAIVELFQAHGCEVERLNQAGLPDLLINWRDRVALVEVKTRIGRIRKLQNEFAQRFPVWLVRDEKAVKDCIQWLKR